MESLARNGFVIRGMITDDIAKVLDLQSVVFSGMPVWTAALLQNHLSVFPEGQFVALAPSGELIGSASSLIIDWDDYAESASWDTITGHGTFDTHNPLGKTLYGADMGVLPDYRRHGIGTLFYEARKKLAKAKGLKRVLVGGRIPKYAEVAHRMSPREYVAEVVSGKRRDPTLSFQIANGFVVLDVVANYLRDPQSRGFATLLEWLNPEYVTSVSLIGAAASKREMPTSEIDAPSSQRRVRIAAVQYQLRPISRFDDFAAQVEFFVRSAREYRSHFILFPEFFTMQLLSYLRDPSPARAVRRLAQLTPQYEALFRHLAEEYRLYIIAGTHPVIKQGELFNAAHLFTPQGGIYFQKKVHLTPTEKGPYQMSRGHGFCIYHTDYGRIAILVCYDIEFPEAARVLAEAGAEILFIPVCTDDRQGYCRVRYCAQARAIENQIYTVLTGTIGNLPDAPCMAANYGQAAILTPSDYLFARDGIAAEGTVNQEQMIVADVDLDLLREQRVNGTVIPLNDLIKDAYDRVIHFDERGRKTDNAA